MMNHDEDGRYEPTRFAFVYDGALVAAELSRWAQLWEADYYAGDCPPPLDVFTWDGDPQVPPVLHRITVSRGEMTENEMIPYLITLPGFHDVVAVSIDGRA